MKRSKAKVVLFLCTGNYFRSRFAEIVFNHAVSRMGLPWRAESRGLALERGTGNVGPLAKEAAAEVTRLGIRDTSVTRMPLAVTEEDLSSADRVVALDAAEHTPLVVERHAAHADRVCYWDVEDRPGVLPRIEKAVNDLIAELLGGKASAEEPAAEAKKEEPPKRSLTAKVGRETKGRKGKGVTLVYEVNVGEAELTELGTKLKNRCGTGGTVKDGRIEIQGDQRERVCAELEAMGFKVKRVGG